MVVVHAYYRYYRLARRFSMGVSVEGANSSRGLAATRPNLMSRVCQGARRQKRSLSGLFSLCSLSLFRDPAFFSDIEISSISGERIIIEMTLTMLVQDIHEINPHLSCMDRSSLSQPVANARLNVSICARILQSYASCTLVACNLLKYNDETKKVS